MYLSLNQAVGIELTKIQYRDSSFTNLDTLTFVLFIFIFIFFW